MDTTPSAAIIVAHGQPSDPDPAEVELADFAGFVSQHLPNWDIRGAPLAKPRALDEAVRTMSPNSIVYPMFMSQGWFTQVQLVKRLGDHPVRIALPFGLDPELPGMAEEFLRGVLHRNGWLASDTQLFLPGHGSGRSPNSARDTRNFANTLASRIQFAELRVGFVEQEPFLSDAASGLSDQSICFPFFAAKRGHVLDDIPDALEEAGFNGVSLDPIGCAPQAPKLVAEALLKMQAAA